MNRIIFILALSFSIHAQAAERYSIAVLAPLDEISHASGFVQEADFPVIPKIYDDGTVIGAIEIGNKVQPFIYKPSTGFRLFAIFDSDYAIPTMLNKNGILVGLFLSNFDGHIHIFAYDLEEEITFDIMNPEFKGLQANSYIGDVQISDDNIIFAPRGNLKYDLDAQALSFDFYECDTMHFNSHGQIVGSRDYPRDFGWFYDPVIGYMPFKPLQESDIIGISPSVISENGYVAGEVYIEGQVGSNLQKGFLWTLNENLVLFDTLGGEDINVQAINKFSDVTGNSTLSNYNGRRGTGDEHAFLYKEGKTTDLGTLGGQFSASNAINDLCEIVGESTIDKKSEPEMHAFIWDKKHGMRDLTRVIPSKTGWNKLIKATSINNSGQIVGIGKYNGVTQLFLLDPL